MQGKPSRYTRTVVALTVALVFVVSLGGEVFARGSSGRSSGGSSRSFSSSSSRSSSAAPTTSSSPSSSSSWGGKSSSGGLTTSGTRGVKPTEPSPTTSSSKPGTASKATMSKADKALYEQAKTKGTAFKTQDEAVNAFKQQNQSKYNSQFTSEPTRRPDYIPQTYTSSSGASHSVVYRPELGGYGYYDSSLGRWMLYSVMADAAMTSMLMHNHGYYYGAPPGAYYGGGGGLTWIGMFILIAFVVAALVRMNNIRRRS
jgi:hypothetical protein